MAIMTGWRRALRLWCRPIAWFCYPILTGYMMPIRRKMKMPILSIKCRILMPKLRQMAGGTGSSHGSGGMVTKLQAAQIAQRAGCHMVLASGRAMTPLSALAEGARATLFEAHDNPHSARARRGLPAASNRAVRCILMMAQSARFMTASRFCRSG